MVCIPPISPAASSETSSSTTTSYRLDRIEQREAESRLATGKPVAQEVVNGVGGFPVRLLYEATGLRTCSVTARPLLPVRTDGFEPFPAWRGQWLRACAWRVRNARVRSPHEYERKKPNIPYEPARPSTTARP